MVFVELYDLCGVHVVVTSCVFVLQVLCGVRPVFVELYDRGAL